MFLDQQILEFLVAKKSLSTKQANQLLAASEGRSLELLLVERGMLDKHSLLGIKSTLCDLQPVDLALLNIDLNVVRLLPGSMSRKFSAVVYGLEDGKLLVALANPTDPFARYFISMRTNREIETRVAYLGDVQALQDRAYPSEDVDLVTGPALLQAPTQTPRVGLTEEATHSSGSSRRVDLPQGPHAPTGTGSSGHLIGRPHQPATPRPASPSLSPAERQKTLDRLDAEIAQRRGKAREERETGRLERDTATPQVPPPAAPPAADALTFAPPTAPLPVPSAFAPPTAPLPVPSPPAAASPASSPVRGNTGPLPPEMKTGKTGRLEDAPAPEPFIPDVMPEMPRRRPEPPPVAPKPPPPPQARPAPAPPPPAPKPEPKAAPAPAPKPAAASAPASSTFTVPSTSRIETKTSETARLREPPPLPPRTETKAEAPVAVASLSPVDEIDLVWEEEAAPPKPPPPSRPLPASTDLLATLSDMATSVAESGRLSYIVPQILKTARQLTGAETAAFLMVQQDRRYISYHATDGAGHDATQYAVPFDETTLAGWCVINEKGLAVKALKADARFDTKAEETAGLPIAGTACVPVRWGAEVVGALLVASPREATFDLRPLFTLAAPLAAAVKARQMESRIHDIRMETVQALLDWSEAGSPGQRQHSSEVAQVASAMARNMALPPNEVDEIFMAALLHDIGLIPDREATEHPQRAGQILQKVRILQKMLPLIRYHHERYDGTGYPHGLQGEAIPLGARVLAVAEAYCEEGLKRFPRRSAEVERFLVRFGTEFDPNLKAAFIRAVNLEG